MGIIADQALALFDAIHALSDRPAKRPRLTGSRSKKTSSAAGRPNESFENKRPRKEVPEGDPVKDEQSMNEEQKDRPHHATN